jgi:hypothetical protein
MEESSGEEDAAAAASLPARMMFCGLTIFIRTKTFQVVYEKDCVLPQVGMVTKR